MCGIALTRIGVNIMVCIFMDKDRAKNHLSLRLCDWCGSPMSQTNYSKNSVCWRCYRLLAGAGISDKEILEKLTLVKSKVSAAS